LLPRWRGAAPIQWAIAHGDPVTGVTLMQMDEGMDTGAILAMESTPIRSADDTESLGKRLSEMGAKLLQTQLPRYVAGEIAAEEQDEHAATMAPLLTKDHGRIDWNRPAEAVHDQVRGMNPWPGAHTTLHGRRIKVHRTRASTLDPEGAPPGQVIGLGEDGILVACGQGTVTIQELQESGRKRVDARAFATGRGVSVGDRFSNEGIEE
jgi:methionyl-tRNA formyltransferase